MASGETPKYDVVLFGATGFVGRITCSYLSERLWGGSVRWATAGRNEAKLATLAEDLDLSVDRIVADSADREALANLAESANVIMSTVGPYSLYGSGLVEACVNAGTDYCDLTGEPQWMQRMIDAHQQTATATGARILHACGFDSIPSDLGVFYTQKMAQAILDEPCTQISMRVNALKGRVSGGTIASMLAMFEQSSDDSELRRSLTNPYALAPKGMRSGMQQNSIKGPKRDKASRRWVAPFVMAPVNTQVVQRSHALMGRPWGTDFLYDEAVITGGGPRGALRAVGLTAGLAGAIAALGVGPLRKLMATTVLPKPGEGPTRQQQENGFFDLRFYGATTSGQQIVTKVTGDRDPGYGSTAKMLSEAAICLVNQDRADMPGGIWTPSTGLGQELIDRLQANAGLTFSVDG